MILKIFRILLASFFIMVAVNSALAADPLLHTEDFTTDTYRDLAATTAWWNTTAGQAGLHPLTPTVVGSVETAGQALNVAVDGHHAFLADNNGLKVVDISDRANPMTVGSVATPGITRHVAVAGNVAYVADSSAGLTVVDITNPDSPAVIGNVDTPGLASSLVVSGNHVYIADNSGDLQVVDITVPKTPVLIGNLALAGQALDVACTGDRVFVAAGSGGVHVVDVSVPSAPSLVITMPTAASASGIDVSGDLLHVAGSSAGLLVMDVSGSGITLRTTVPLTGNASDTAVLGNIVLVAMGSGGVEVVDVSARSGPVILGTIATSDSALGVAADGNHAFAAVNARGLEVMEVLNPVTIQLLADEYLLPGPDKFVLDGDYLITSEFAGDIIRIHDVSIPEVPVQLGSIPGVSGSLAIDGNHLYVSSFGWLEIHDLSDTSSPTMDGSVNVGTSFAQVVAVGDYVYGTTTGDMLYVVNVSDPSAPFVAGSAAVPGDNGLVVDGDLLFAIGGGCCIPGDLSIVDISDPTAPGIIGSFTPSPSGETEGLAVSGNYAYVGVNTFAPGDSLFTVDITNPENPVRVSALNVPAYDIVVHGDRLYTASGLNSPAQVSLIDISQADQPELIRTQEVVSSGLGLAGLSINGDTAFGVWYAGVNVWSVYPMQLASRFFREGDVVQSQPLITTGREAVQVKLTSVQSGTVNWAFRGTLGMWQTVPANNPEPYPWVFIPPSDLVWRATLEEDHVASPGVGPVIDSCEIEWRYAEATIDSITDVPGDQGSWARVHFTRSAYDYLYSVTPYQAEDYVLWRRTTSSTAKSSARVANPWAHPEAAAIGLSLPPGTWEVISSFSPMEQEKYIALTPTLADSTAEGVEYTVFVISTKVSTGSSHIYHVSPPDSSYSIDNIAPGVPSGLAVSYNTGSGNELTWDAAVEPDFQYFRIYRSTDPGFTPGPGDLVFETAASGWIDPVVGGFEYHYMVTTLDYAGNESGPAGPSSVSGVQAGETPARTALSGVFPNPFNPVTKIEYALDRDSQVDLSVYNVAGKKVQTLVAKTQTAGRHTLTWNAARQASGVYFLRMVANGRSFVERVTLLK